MFYNWNRNIKSNGFCKKLLRKIVNWVVLYLLYFAANSLYAASYIHVVHVGNTRKSSFFVVNRGTSNGFNVGTKICIFDLNPTGDSPESLLCEEIIRAKKNLCAVKISKEQLSLISIDQVAAIEGTTPIFPKDKDLETDSDDSVLAAFSDDTQSELNSNIFVKPVIIVGLPLAIMAPVTFQLPKFNASQFATKGASSWSAGDTINRSILGIYFAYEKPFSENWIMRPEFKYQFFSMVKAQTDFDPTNLNTSIESSAVSHFYELRLSTLKAKKISDHWNFNFGPSFSAAYSKVKFAAVAEKTSGTDDGYAQYQSFLHILSLDGIAKINYQTQSFHFEFGLNLALPVLEFSRSNTLSSDTDTAVSSNDADSISQALAHKKNSFGFSTLFGVGFIF